MQRHAKKQQSLASRHRRVRSTISGTAIRPRLSVRRTLKHIHAQLIDDKTGRTLVYASDVNLKMKGTKSDRAVAVGKALAAAAKTKNIQHVVFDRGGSKYHGRVKALADAARSGGLTF